MSDDAQNEKLLHQRLLSRDATAPEETARKYLPLIEKHLAARAWIVYHINDRELIWNATVDAVLLDYILHPERFDPNKSGLLGYLKRAAERDLINAVQKSRRQRRGEDLYGDVEEGIRTRNKPSELSRIMRDAEQETVSSIQTERDAMAVTTVGNERDRELLRLMTVGERSTSKFAAVLGIESLPITEQRRIVKQHKDRLKVQLKRSKRRV
jgi:DNA-directed RNA polymerase specialized sigma24 family protein